MFRTNRLIAAPPFIAKMSFENTSGAALSSRRTVWTKDSSMGFQCQERPVFQFRHPSFVAADRERIPSRNGVYVHQLRFTRAREEKPDCF